MRLLLLPVLMLASCTGFPRGWQQARRSTPPDAVSGAWIGTWRSDVNGHHGGLRAVASQKADGAWEFRFQASWARVLCAGFDLEPVIQPAPAGGYTFTGSKDLGSAFGGTFTCNGTIRREEFHARYKAKLDHGVMTLRRLRTGDRDN